MSLMEERSSDVAAAADIISSRFFRNFSVHVPGEIQSEQAHGRKKKDERDASEDRKKEKVGIIHEIDSRERRRRRRGKNWRNLCYKIRFSSLKGRERKREKERKEMAVQLERASQLESN